MTLIKLDTNDGLILLNSQEEFVSFYKEQRAVWDFLRVNPTRSRIKEALHAHVIPAFDNLGSLAERYVLDESTKNVFEAALIHAFIERKIPLKDGAFSNYFLNLSRQSEVVANAALATKMRISPIQGISAEYIRGVVLATFFEERVDYLSIQGAKDSLIKLYSDFSLSKDTFDRESKISLKSFKDTENSYKEGMKLKASVTYWTDKSRGHENAAKRYRNFLIGFACFLCPLILGGLFCLAKHLMSIPVGTTYAVYVVFALFSLIVCTVPFWMARVLTRLFLSEHHLSIDSKERAVMAKTYLALTAEGQATEAERHIVLGALFRPTTDGIIKDDAAPDFLPSAMLSKFGSR